MFVILSKILPVFIYPLGLVTMLLALALLLQRRLGWQRVCLGVALAIILVTGNSWVAASLVRSLEWQYLPPDPIPSADAIVVLGGGTDAPQYPRSMVEINGAGDRILYAARLYHEGKAPHILLSGGSIEWLDNRRSTSSAEEMAAIMQLLNVPPEALWLQKISQNTYEDALYSQPILNRNGARHILLVTSASHMPRAAALFRKQGLNVTPVPVDYEVTRNRWENLNSFDFPNVILNFFPNIGNMGMVTGALKEYIGLMVYRYRGWL